MVRGITDQIDKSKFRWHLLQEGDCKTRHKRVPGLLAAGGIPILLAEAVQVFVVALGELERQSPAAHERGRPVRNAIAAFRQRPYRERVAGLASTCTTAAAPASKPPSAARRSR